MSEPVTISFNLAKKTVVEERSETIPFVISVKGVKSYGPPACFMLIIDTSLSMDGEKIFRAKLSSLKILDLLREKDYVAVYSFANDFVKNLEPSSLSKKHSIEQAIVSLKLGSGTNFYDMFKNIINEVKTVQEELGVYVIRLILITDGQPTTGVKRIDKILELVDKLAELRVSALVIGVGTDYNEKLLLSIANKLNGVFEHVDNAKKLEEIMHRYTMVAKDVSARNVAVTLRLKPHFKALVYNKAYRVTENGVEINVGDVSYGEEVLVVGDISVPPLTRGFAEIGDIQVTYVNPIKNEIEIFTKPSVAIESLPITSLSGVSVDKDVVYKVDLIRSAGELERSIEKKDVESIMEKLSNIAELTLKIGSEELTSRTLSLKEKIEKTGLSPEFSKDLASLISRIVSGKLKTTERVEEK